MSEKMRHWDQGVSLDTPNGTKPRYLQVLHKVIEDAKSLRIFTVLDVD